MRPMVLCIVVLIHTICIRHILLVVLVLCPKAMSRLLAMVLWSKHHAEHQPHPHDKAYRQLFLLVVRAPMALCCLNFQQLKFHQ